MKRLLLLTLTVCAFSVRASASWTADAFPTVATNQDRQTPDPDSKVQKAGSVEVPTSNFYNDPCTVVDCGSGGGGDGAPYLCTKKSWGTLWGDKVCRRDNTGNYYECVEKLTRICDLYSDASGLTICQTCLGSGRD